MEIKVNNLRRVSQKLFTGSVIIKEFELVEIKYELFKIQDLEAEIFFEANHYTPNEGVPFVDIRSIDVAIYDTDFPITFSLGPSSRVITQLEDNEWFMNSLNELVNKYIDMFVKVGQYNG